MCVDTTAAMVGFVDSNADRNGLEYREVCGRLSRQFLQLIPEGAGPVNSPFLFLIFLLAVLRLYSGASG